MSLAKLISLTGSLIYLIIFIISLFFPEKIKYFLLQNIQLESKTLLAIIIAATFLISIINFTYFYYLYLSSKKGEEVNSAAFLSIQLIFLPFIFLVMLVMISS